MMLNACIAELTPEEIESFDLIPMSGRIVIKEYEIESYGGIVVPEQAKGTEMRTNEGRVIAKAEDVFEFQINDLLYYGQYSGAWIHRGGKKYRIMNVDDVLGKVREIASQD